MRLFERVLVQADQGASGALLRLVLGYVTGAAWWRLFPGAPGWTLFAFFLTVLAAVRVVPLAFRKVVPFSRETQATWYQRRQLAKRFDSYQWHKLLWIGAGLALFGLQTGWASGAVVILSAVCVGAGACGLMIWKARSNKP